MHWNYGIFELFPYASKQGIQIIEQGNFLKKQGNSILFQGTPISEFVGSNPGPETTDN